MTKRISIILVLCFMTVFTFGCATKQAAVVNTTPENYQLQPAVKGDTVAIINTDMGTVEIKLFPKEAPKAVENFTLLAKKGYYNGLTFHRIINNFMIQGGDPLGNGTGGESAWGKPFEDEYSDKLHNYRGALSMANSGPSTNGSQFFIVQNSKLAPGVDQWMEDNKIKPELAAQFKKLGGTPWLDNHHTVFGQVIKGMEVVDKIAASPADPQTGKPEKDVKIVSVEVITQK